MILSTEDDDTDICLSRWLQVCSGVGAVRHRHYMIFLIIHSRCSALLPSFRYSVCAQSFSFTLTRVCGVDHKYYTHTRRVSFQLLASLASIAVSPSFVFFHKEDEKLLVVVVKST